MQEMFSKDLLNSMDLRTLKELRAEASKKIKDIKNKEAFRSNIYIPAEIRGDFEKAAEWAHAHNYTQKNTRWSFCKFCIVNMVNMIKQQIKAEEAAKSQAVVPDPSGMDLQPGASIQSSPQYPKIA